MNLNYSGISTCTKFVSSSKPQITFINLLLPQEVKLSGHQITTLWKKQVMLMVTSKHINVLKVSINGLTP